MARKNIEVTIVGGPGAEAPAAPAPVAKPAQAPEPLPEPELDQEEDTKPGKPTRRKRGQ